MVEASDIRVKILLQYMQRRKMSKTENELKYDENVKRFLSQKIILAHILVSCVKEFKGMDAAEVVAFIEGEPEVSSAEVHPKGTVIEDFVSPKITGMNTEDASDEEGTIFFDIKFCAYVPSIGEKIKLIIDVEAQNNFSPGYDIMSFAEMCACGHLHKAKKARSRQAT